MTAPQGDHSRVIRDRKSAFTHVNMFVVHVPDGPQKPDHFQKFLTRVYDDAER